MDKYFVLGNPIEQSRSPFIHQQFALQTKQSLQYEKQFVTLGDFSAVITDLIKNSVKGANVTAPFKEQALALCTQLSARAKMAGAVNTLSFNNGEIIGDNTDGIGLVNDLKSQQVTLKGKRILLLGAGGAARGVILPLLDEEPEQLVIANRTLAKAELLSEQFINDRISVISFEQTEDDKFDVIINATSASLTANVPNISANCITNQTVCYDMVYAKQATNFLLWAESNGAGKIIDGLGMLVGQAAESFYQWRSVQPDISSVLTKVRKQINAS